MSKEVRGMRVDELISLLEGYPSTALVFTMDGAPIFDAYEQEEDVFLDKNSFNIYVGEESNVPYKDYEKVVPKGSVMLQ